MIELIDFTDWKEFDGFSEGSGRSEKIWLRSNDGIDGLFKFPKMDTVTGNETTEHISEHLAYKIGNYIGVETAKVSLGKYNGRIGSMSYSVCEPHEALIEGISFITGEYPRYNAQTMINEEDNTYYSLDHIISSVKGFSEEPWIEMMMFDFLIGNRDRHHGNWALLVKRMEDDDPDENIRGKLRVRNCPLYDNGSSLCCFVNETQVKSFLGNDIRRFNALVDSKSQSMIRIDGTNESMPSHRNVVKHLLYSYPIAKDIAARFINGLSKKIIDELLSEYPETILSRNKNELIRCYIMRKLEILEELAKEVSRNV